MKKRMISFMLTLFMVLTSLAPAVNVSAETTAEYTQVNVVNPVANSYYNSGNDGGPAFAFNGNNGNWWHTNYGNAATGNKPVGSFTNAQVSEIPEFYKVSDDRVWIGGKFDKAVNLGKFTYHARTDTANNYMQQWALYTANVANGEPTDADFALAANGTFNASCSGSGADAEVVLAKPVKATHFRLVAFAFVGGQVTASKIAMYSAQEIDENGARLVYLREGESATCTLDGSIDVSNPNLDNFDSQIATMEVIPGEASKYPYSVAQLATATTSFNGEEKELEKCLFTFDLVEGSESTYVISNTESGNTIYFASGVNSATQPCATSGTNLNVIVGSDSNQFTFNNKYIKNGAEVNGYLYFHKEDGERHFNRNSTLADDKTRFDLFTPAADAPADSGIKGYKQITTLAEIVDGQQYLIAAKANNGKYYILNPVATTGAEHTYVAEIVTYEAPKVPGVQLASAQNRFDVTELKKVTDCLFTFTGTNEAGKYIISGVTAEGTTVYLNPKLSTAGTIPTTATANNAKITVAKKSDSEPALFTLFDNSNSSNGGYLYFHKSNGCYFNRNGNTTSACSNGEVYFELYEVSKNAPSDSAVPGFAKVASVDDIKDGGQYLITTTDTATPANYYFLRPYLEGSNYHHVAKLTDTMLDVEVPADTQIIFTGVAEGETSVTIGGVTYRIIVANDERTITLRKGESICISGTLQSVPQGEVDIEETIAAPYFKVQDVTEGVYLIGKSSHVLMNSASSSTNPKGLAMASANYTQGDYAQYVWKVTAKDAGYTIQDVNGQYINFTEQSGDQCSVVLSDTEQVLSITKRSDGSYGISYNGHYMNDFGETHTNVAGWRADNNAWYFYSGIEKSVVTAGNVEGTATFTLNGINYTIVSIPADVAGLQADITNAENTYAQADYLGREWGAYQTALAEAKEWAAKEATITQPEVEAARAKLANAIAGLILKPVYDGSATAGKELAAGAPTGTTEEQPFDVGTGGSANFRIPAMVTLSDGTIIAAADARWDHSMDGCSIDIMVSKSTDNGKTWKYTLPAFFNDSTNAKHMQGACFIDPVLVRDANDKIYMMVDLYPAEIAINTAPKKPSSASGFIDILGEKRLVLYTSNDPAKQSDTNYSYYVGDYVKEGDKELAPVYEVLGENEYSDTASYYMDSYFYLYTADKEPMYCVQLGDTTKKVQQNVFFYNSLLHVRAATYLYLITSEDKGETWSAPMLLNSQIRKNQDIFYGVGPGAGLWIDNGTEDGMVLLPAYTHSNERASFIYSSDGGVTWKRSQNSTTDQSSESCLVQLNDTTVRHFYRSWDTELKYTDHTLVNGEWVAGTKTGVSGVARKANNQVSAIRYSKTIDGKPVIVFSTATKGGNYDRKDGKIYLFTVDMETEGMPMTLVATYDNVPNNDADVYAYSSIAELEDGSIGLLYEYDDTAHDYKITYKTIPMSELAPEVKFDIPASEDGVETELLGYTLSLEGNIGVNFHMRLGEAVIADSGAKMNFTLEREDGEEILEIPLAEAEYVESKDCYVFKCVVPVKDMETEIKAQIVLADGRKGSEFTYTVKKYIDYMLQNDETYTEEIELVEAMSDFGNYAATYFAGETVGETPELPELPELSQEDLAYLENQQAEITEDKDSIYFASSLLLKSDTILRHYFTKEVAVEGYDVVKKGDLYYIESEGVPAHKLGEKIETTVVVEGEEITISYSPLSYAYIAINQEGVDESLASLMHAMYLYHQAAQDYRQPTTD